MSGNIQPVAVYAMRIPPGDVMVPAVPQFAAMVSRLLTTYRSRLTVVVPPDHGCH